MKLIELLNRIDSKTLLDLLLARLPDYERRPKTKEEHEKALLNFGKRLDKIKAIKLREGDDGRLVVAHVKELGEDDEFRYDSFIMNGDGKRYGITCSPWGEILNMQVLQKSIELYGETEVAAQLFWDMTFFGLTERKHKSECKKLLESIKETEKEPRENWKTAEEFFRELDAEMIKKYGDEWTPHQEPTEEEKKAQSEKMQADWAEHEKLYKMLNDCVIAELGKKE